MKDLALIGLMLVLVALYFTEWNRTYGRHTGIASPLAYFFIHRRLKKRR